VTDQPTPAHR